ncbi:MAG: hypothetical protein QNJ16_15325 [Rhodobacter sp.]|nr:hypothetical protein [Rhodobacter sp.]
MCIAAVLALGGLFGCRIDEGGVHACPVAGADLGEAAYALGLLAAWGSLLFGRVAVGAGLHWAIVAGIDRHRRKR